MTTSIHITALDGIVNVNSLFTLAVFVGLAWNPRDPSYTLISDSRCQPGPRVAEDLIAFHVYSFSSFLFSSLVALGLKQAIRLNVTANFHYPSQLEPIANYINKSLLRVGMLVSAAGSVCGSVFLMIALINLVQIKVGTLACGSGYAFGAVVPLVILVPSALLIYVCVVLYAFTR